MDELDEKFELFIRKSGINLLPYQKGIAKKMLHHEPIVYVPPRGMTKTDPIIVAGLAAMVFQEGLKEKPNGRN